jgi:hypothetical protein
MATQSANHTKVYKCSVPLCSTKAAHGFHSFPANPDSRLKWQNICQLSKVTSHNKVCQLHFDKSDYMIAPGTLNGLNEAIKPRLEKDACPVLHLPKKKSKIIDLSDSGPRHVLVNPYLIIDLNENIAIVDFPVVLHVPNVSSDDSDLSNTVSRSDVSTNQEQQCKTFVSDSCMNILHSGELAYKFSCFHV